MITFVRTQQVLVPKTTISEESSSKNIKGHCFNYFRPTSNSFQGGIFDASYFWSGFFLIRTFYLTKANNKGTIMTYYLKKSF